MTTDLIMLALSAALCLLLPNVAIASLPDVPGGFAWGLGNRDTPAPTLPAWAERARARRSGARRLGRV